MSAFRIKRISIFFQVVGLALLVSVSSAFAQQMMKTPERMAGMRRMHFESIMQSKSGPIWMATDNGLIEFNGIDRQSYDRRDSLVGEWCTALAQDSAGTIWVGHNNGRVSLFNPQTRTFKAFRPKEGTPQKRITAMLASKNGSIWFATDSIGIWVYDGKRMYQISEEDGLLNKSQQAAPTAQEEKLDAELEELANMIPGIEGGVELASSKVETYCLYEDPGGNIWAGTDAGIVRIDTKGKSKDKFKYKYIGLKEGLADNIVRGIVGDNQGMIWIAMGDSGLAQFNPKTQQITKMGRWTFGSIESIVFHPILKQLWIGTRKGEVIVYDIKNRTTIKFAQFESTVLSLCVDQEGNVIAGTESTMFVYTGERLQRFQQQANGLPSNNILSVFAAPDGWVYVGTDKGAARLRYNKDLTTYTENIPLRSLNGGASPQVISIDSDKFGRIWLGTFGNGVYNFDPRTNQITNYSTANGLSHNDIYSIAGNVGGYVWLGTLGGGLLRIGFAADGRVAEIKTYTAADGIEAPYVYALHGTNANDLWVATDGYGLYRINNKGVTQFGEAQGLPARTLLALESDSKGRIWIATDGFGLIQYDGSDFLAFDSEKGFRHESPFALAVDSLGQIYVGNKFGIDVYNPETDQVFYYGDGDGVGSFEPQQNAVSSLGQVFWWGTPNGLLRLAPFSSVPARTGPMVSIQRMRLFLVDEPMIPNKEFTYNENNFTFDFVGVSLSASSKVTYQYRLEGYEEDWSLSSNVRFHTYSNLPAGKYRFVVRADNGSGIFNEDSYSFEIRPPFWQTWWFYSLSTIILVGGGYLAFRYRVQKIEQEKRILEEKVEERTKEISHQKEIIEEKNNDITESIEYARRLQFAILPEVETIQRDLPDTFIFYQPKDIVSGDFYWFNRIGQNWVIAGVDCTGHGVPGAFMSVVGFNQLNEVINNQAADLQADEILNLMDIRVRVVLRQDSAASVTKDGMDMGLCILNPETGVLQYAGAYRPLYVFHKEELVELKGDRFPIGGAQQEEKIFRRSEIQLEPGDAFYIFSDGLVDQFGGPNQRKYTPKRLKKLLQEVHNLPVEEQHRRLREDFMGWMGNSSQLDDVLIIGIRYLGPKKKKA